MMLLESTQVEVLDLEFLKEKKRSLSVDLKKKKEIYQNLLACSETLL